MFENKLKEELFKKIILLEKTYRKTGRIEKENPNLEYEELEEISEEYLNLVNRCADLEQEIEELLVETKYFPLCGLSSKQIRVIPSEPTFIPDIFRSDGSKIEGGLLTNPEAIEKYLEIELIKTKEEIKKRIGRLNVLKLNFEIDSWTRFLYKQIAQCFTYGLFEACCILCRATVEAIAKKYIELKGLGELLVGKNRERKRMGVIEILRKLKVSSKAITSYSKITNKADRILHNRNIFASEGDALLSIENLHLFIQKFPKML